MKARAKLLAIAAILILSVPLLSCAKNADGGYTVSGETIVRAFKTGKLVADESGAWNGPGNKQKMDIPALPRGQIRLAGTFKSDCGKFFCEGVEAMTNMRGLETYGDCKFGEACMDGGWFYADIDPASGEIVSARAYFFGNAPHNTDFYGYFAKKFKGSYGYAKSNGFAIGIVGETGASDMSFLGDDERVTYPSWPDWQNGDAVFVIRGKGNLLKAKNGTTFKFDCYEGLKSLDQKINMKNIDCDINVIAEGVARLERGE
ncbi:MAG: hypothetical protein K2H64_11370 [Desulfovibrio sp.]|nr:hypothetical protein [Desulfovibrio sp.]